MAFENLNFCENQRLTKNVSFTMENLIIFEKKLLDKSFKEKSKKFNELTIDNSKFENYWSL